MYVSLFLHVYIHTHTYIYVNYIYICVSHALVVFTSCFLLLKKLYNKLTLLSGIKRAPCFGCEHYFACKEVLWFSRGYFSNLSI